LVQDQSLDRHYITHLLMIWDEVARASILAIEAAEKTIQVANIV
jgi:hypothetical protein